MAVPPNATTEECLSILSSCRASICVVEDMEQFEKVFNVREFALGMEELKLNVFCCRCHGSNGITCLT